MAEFQPFNHDTAKCWDFTLYCTRIFKFKYLWPRSVLTVVLIPGHSDWASISLRMGFLRSDELQSHCKMQQRGHETQKPWLQRHRSRDVWVGEKARQWGGWSAKAVSIFASPVHAPGDSHGDALLHGWPAWPGLRCCAWQLRPAKRNAAHSCSSKTPPQKKSKAPTVELNFTFQTFRS